jgi:hypothetical protein
MTTYKVIETPTGEQIIKMDADGREWWVPKNLDNSDYQRYLNPEAEQSTPIVINEAETI